MVPCSIVVQHLPNLRRVKLSIKSTASNIFSKSMLCSRSVPLSLVTITRMVSHVILKFNISNTLPDTVLEQVSVIMQPQADEGGLVEDFIIPLPALTASNSPGIVYVSFTRQDPALYAISSFQCTLKYISKELDPSTGAPEEEGYEDEYQVEEVELSAGGDYIVPSYSSFGAEWDRLRSAPSATETFALSAMESLKGATFFWLELMNQKYPINIEISSCM